MTIVNDWIDVHAHFTPPMTPAESEARWAAMREACWTGPKPPDWSIDATLATMDRVGIAMQMLSNIPKSLDALRASNDYGASVVARHPSRFGLLAALPTDDPDAALAEISRGYGALRADGFAVTCHYNGVYLGDPRLEPVWAELDRRGAAVFAHPDAYKPGSLGRPAAVLEVAFETTRTIVDMLYAGVFRRYPNFRLVLAHCGAALPALSGRLMRLGTQPWVPNPNGLTDEELRAHLAALYLDTAMTGTAHTLAPALEITSADHIVYGSDCGVPCTVPETAIANIEALLAFTGLAPDEIEAIGHNALRLFPAAAERIARNRQGGAPRADRSDIRPEALIEVAIEAKGPSDAIALRHALAALVAEDPDLQVKRDRESGQIILGGRDEAHLDGQIDAIRRVHGVAVNVGAPQVAYRETLTRRIEKDYTHKKQTGGVGQFARVKIVFEPTRKGAGSAFEAKIVGGAVPNEYLPGVEKGIASVMGSGILAGFPVVDVKATLIDGAYHDVDSSVLAFETASRAAFREALKEGRSVLLEPIMKVEVTTPEDYIGFVTGDLRARRGQVRGQALCGSAVVIDAMVPLANLFGYVNQLRSGTQGRASFTAQFAEYRPVTPPDDDEPPPAMAAALRRR